MKVRRNQYAVTCNAKAFFCLRMMREFAGYEVRRNGRVINTMRTQHEANEQCRLHRKFDKAVTA